MKTRNLRWKINFTGTIIEQRLEIYDGEAKQTIPLSQDAVSFSFKQHQSVISVHLIVRWTDDKDNLHVSRAALIFKEK